MSHAVVDDTGRVRQLDTAAEPSQEVTEEQVSDPERLARLLTQLLRDQAKLQRRWEPRRIDFRDVLVNGDGVTVYSLQHNFNGRVNWWVVRLETGNTPALTELPSSDENTLRFISNEAGPMTIRVEEAG